MKKSKGEKKADKSILQLKIMRGELEKHDEDQDNWIWNVDRLYQKLKDEVNLASGQQANLRKVRAKELLEIIVFITKEKSVLYSEDGEEFCAVVVNNQGDPVEYKTFNLTEAAEGDGKIKKKEKPTVSEFPIKNFPITKYVVPTWFSPQEIYKEMGSWSEEKLAAFNEYIQGKTGDIDESIREAMQIHAKHFDEELKSDEEGDDDEEDA